MQNRYMTLYIHNTNMSFNSNLFDISANFGGRVFTGLSGRYSNKKKEASLTRLIAEYKSYGCATAPPNTRCDVIITDMSAVYNTIKNEIAPATAPSDYSLMTSTQDELKRKLASMQSETGILATQSSDYLNVVMSSVLWTALAGGLVTYLIITTNKK